ncbi:MAG: acyl-homoserine-lactone synthase [Paracoccaceae bacterium]
MTAREPTAESGTAAISVLRAPEDLAKWNLVADFLRLRRQVFMEQMSWDLTVAGDMEYEQYDTFASIYVIAHEGGTVLGGARLIRTDNRSRDPQQRYSYMIRDAKLGLLPGLPTDLCDEEPPVDPAIWELTRFAAPGGVGLGADILRHVNDFLKSQGGRSCLFLGPPAFMRMAKGMGFSPRPLGKIVGNRDGRFLAFECAVI